MKKLVFVLVILSGTAAYAQHQNMAPEELEEVVLVDEQSGLSRKTPYNLSTVSMSGISEQGNPNGIMGLLRQESGVYGAEFGQGIVKPFIRGLGFSRVVTIYQGNKLENHQWGADHGLGVNELGIKEISVIKGPASVLYGSGALGGVIIAQDEDYFLRSNRLTGKIGSTYNSNSHGLRTYASIGKLFPKEIIIAADLAYETHADYKNGNGRLIGNSRFNVKSLRLHAGLERENFQNKLSFAYNDQHLGIIIDEEMDNKASLAGKKWDRNMQLPFQKVEDFLLSYNQSMRSRNFESYFHLSHHINNRKEIEQHLDSLDLGLKQQHSFLNARIAGKQGQMQHNLGVQGSFIQTENQKNVQEILLPDAKTLEGGIFYSVSADLEHIIVQGAFRYDYRKVTADASSQQLIHYGFELSGNPEDRKMSRSFDGFTGSLGVSSSFNEFHQLKLNLATGFRAPDLAELFSNGPHPGTNRFEKGNDRFEREQSLQLDATYTYTKKRFTGSISLFGTRFDNYIFFSATDGTHPQDELEVWAYQQRDARFYGLELELKHYWLRNRQLRTNLSASLVRAEDRESGESLSFIAPDNLNLEVGYHFPKAKNLYLLSSLQLVNAQNKTGALEAATPGYALFNVGVSKEFFFMGKSLHLGVTAKNILNKNYVDHLSILRPFEISSPGRNVRINLKYGF